MALTNHKKMEHQSRFWIAIPLEEKPGESPPEMIAHTDSGAFKFVVGYQEKAKAEEDIALARNKSESPFVLLEFDARTRIFKLLEGNQPAAVAKGKR